MCKLNGPPNKKKSKKLHFNSKVIIQWKETRCCCCLVVALPEHGTDDECIHVFLHFRYVEFHYPLVKRRKNKNRLVHLHGIIWHKRCQNEKFIPGVHHEMSCFWLFIRFFIYFFFVADSVFICLSSSAVRQLNSWGK